MARRPPLAAVIALVVVLAVVTGAVLSRSGGSGSDHGPAAAPAIRLPSVRGDGVTVDLASFRGRPVVVNFFASWCVPCRKELPHFVASAARYHGKVAFMGVAHQDDADAAAKLLREFSVPYPAGNDPLGNVARRYHLRGMPSTAFVTADGRLFGVVAGQLGADELDDWLSRLVASNHS